jgi:hypothetical protein
MSNADNGAPKAQPDIAGVPITSPAPYRPWPWCRRRSSDNERAARARIEHEVDPATAWR